MCAEPVGLCKQPFQRKKDQNGEYDRRYEVVKNGKSPCVSPSVSGRRWLAEPITNTNQVGAMPRPNGELSTSQGFRIYDAEHKSVTLKGLSGGAGGKTGLYALPVDEQSPAPPQHQELTEREMDHMVRDHQKRRWNFCARPGEKEKAPIVTANIHKGVPYNVCADPYYKIYAEPCEWSGDKPTKAKSYADGKIYTVYEVQDGQITIKDKRYPIKLQDGFYIIRKLTVSECKRLQTVPDWYEFPVSNSQAYKMLGNGWTCDVITHLFKATIAAS